MQLGDYHRAFTRALLADGPLSAAPSIARLVEQPGFAVYRNTVLKGCIDALQANFPAVARLVGVEWFRAAAAVYARQHLPRVPTLLTYGESFPAFLAQFEPAAELPYLADVARVDRLWIEAHVAADDDVLPPAALAHLAPHDMARIGLRLHPATRWFWSGECPVATLWQRNRDAVAADGDAIEWRAEGVLLTRPGGAVLQEQLPEEGAALLTAFARDASIEEAVTAALAVNPAADLAALINQLLQAGAFNGLHALADREASP
jgi:hypothetical protein